MKRVRYLELAKIADDICVLLLNAKIRPEEGCMIRRIAETQWSAMGVQYYERQSDTPTPVFCEDAPDIASSDLLSDNL